MVPRATRPTRIARQRRSPMPEAGKTIEIEVLRYRPEPEDKPVWQRYTVPYSDDMSVLQGLQRIKDDIDGSCGMMVNGKPALSCKTFLRDLLPGAVRVEALAHFPIERDLVVSVDDFVKKLEGIKPDLIAKEPRTRAEGEY